MCLIGLAKRVQKVARKNALSGYRAWGLDGLWGGRIKLLPTYSTYSTVENRTWSRREAKSNLLPTVNNPSGLHAYTTLRRVKRQYQFGVHSGKVFGKILQWGHTALHRYGQRSERARIVEIWAPRWVEDRVIKALRRRYHCRVHVLPRN